MSDRCRLGTLEDVIVTAIEVLRLNFDGNFTDSSASAHVITAYENAQISTAIKKTGSGSFLCDNDSWIEGNPSEDLTFGTGNFSIEFDIYQIALAPEPSTALTLFESAGTGNQDLLILSHNDGSISVGNFSGAYATGAGARSLNTWHNVKVVRIAGTLSLYFDDVLSVDGPDSNNYGSSDWWFGGIGYMDNVVVTKG